MQAIWLEDQSLSVRDDLPIPEPGQGEALIRVRLAGICSTDLEMVRGYYPFTGILGHEFVGVIEEAPVNSLIGMRVTGEINKVCRVCKTCKRGDFNHCENRTTLGIHNLPGCFAEYLTLPLENLHYIPEIIPDQIAVFTEPLAATLQIQEQVHIQPEESVLIIGAGRLGQLVAQTITLAGCDLDVVIRHNYQQEILEARNISTVTEKQITPKKYDLVVEATGSPDGFLMAQGAVRPGGKLVLKSTYATDLCVNFSSLVVDEITIIGSRCGPFEPALRLLEAGWVDPIPLISARYPLANGLSAIKHAAQSGVFKVLLDI